MIYANFESILTLLATDNEIEGPNILYTSTYTSYTYNNINIILFAVIVTNWYMLISNIVSLKNFILVKTRFTNLLMIWWNVDCRRILDKNNNKPLAIDYKI